MNRQAQALRVHFFRRFFDRDSGSQSGDAGDARERVIQLLALLATPGLMMSMSLAILGVGSRDISSSERYVFVCYGMVVSGLVMAIKWNSLVPDRRDYLNLSSLPIAARNVFSAKIVSLGVFLSLFVIATNIFPTLIIPALYAESSGSLAVWPQAVFAHVVGTVGGALFMILMLAALHGLLINVLTPTAFRRITPSVQVGVTAVLTTVFLTFPLVTGSIEAVIETDSRLLDYFPMIWFLGLYESLVPGVGVDPTFVGWARNALLSVLAAASVCGITYLAGYRRHMGRVLESESSDAIPPRLWNGLAKEVLNRTLLRSPYERASFYFIGKVAGRSPKHRVFSALWIGAGIGLALSSLFAIDRSAAFPFVLSEKGMLEAPLILSFLVVAGVRATFDVPYALSANWVFHISSERAGEYLKATMKWVFVARALPLYVVLAALEFAYFPMLTAAAYMFVDMTLTWVLIAALFLTFRKIPYACSQYSNRIQLAALALVYTYAFTAFVSYGGELKRWSVAAPGHLLWFCVGSTVLMTFHGALRHKHSTRLNIVFEEVRPSHQQLNLSG